MAKTATVIGIVFATVSIAFASQINDRLNREVPFRGGKLEGQVYLCASDRVRSAGFRRNALSGEVGEILDVSPQSNITTWRITLKGSRADVATFTGATQTLDATKQFTMTTSKDGLLLSRIQKDPLSAEAITIDVLNGSFLYSGQDMSQFMNKTNVFVGSCRSFF